MDETAKPDDRDFERRWLESQFRWVADSFRRVDRELDEQFRRVDKEMDPLLRLPEVVAQLMTELKATREDVKEAKQAAEGTQKILLGFFSALLIVLVGAIVTAVIAL